MKNYKYVYNGISITDLKLLLNSTASTTIFCRAFTTPNLLVLFYSHNQLSKHIKQYD